MRILEQDGRWGAEIPIEDVRQVILLPGKRALLRSEFRQFTIRLSTGEVLGRAMTHGGAALAFHDRFLVRSRGRPQQIEFLDANRGALRLTIHPLDEDWIAFTPDGRWDASAGARSNVAIFRDGRPVEPGKRRTPGLVRSVLSPH